jgi:two-component system, NarL family, sensor histidine kinase UhpB
MVKKQPDGQTPDDLRRQAEAQLRTTRMDVDALPASSVQQLVHELQVHQVELQMQNEELRRTQLELESARDRYANLYNFAPVGLLTLDTDGLIVEANLRACTLLGVNRKDVARRTLATFVEAGAVDTFDAHCRSVMSTGTSQACDLRLRSQAGALWVRMKSLAAYDECGGIIGWRTTLVDISDQKRAQQELEQQRTRLDGIISCAMDAIVTVDEAEQIVLFNHAAEGMFLCPAGEAVGQSLDRFIPLRFRQAHHGHLAAFSKNSEASPAMRSMQRLGPLFGLRANGEEFPFEASISRVLVEGRPLMTAIIRDITERLRAEEALRKNEEQFRNVFEHAATGIAIADWKGRFLQCNPAYCTITGYTEEELLTMPFSSLIYAEDRPENMAQIRRLLEGELSSFEVENRYLTKAGALVWVHKHVSILRTHDGRPDSLMALVMDVSGRKRAEAEAQRREEEVRQHGAELEALTRKLFTAQETERQRLARDLHDDVSQRLAALVFDVAALEEHPPGVPEGLTRALQPVRGQLEQLSDDIHNLAYRLHPSLIEHAGLQPAIEDHIEQITKRTGLAIALEARRLPSDLPIEPATCLFRVLQESLHNVAKHAEATAVTVRVSGSTRGVGLSVTDNGRGFNPADDTHHNGLGLVSMQERLRMLNGFLRVHSRPANGTKICAWIPSQEAAS